MASDGLLEKLTPAEVCATAAAVADGLPPPLRSPQLPAAIPMGPVDVPAAAVSTHMPSSAALQLAQQQPPCAAKPGVIACEDCCGLPQRRAPRKAQLIAETLQQAAFNRTALDNIAVVVIPLQRCVCSSCFSLLCCTSRIKVKTDGPVVEHAGL